MRLNSGQNLSYNAVCSVLLLFLGISAATVIMCGAQQLPNQPASFANRGANPFLAYSFRQTECASGSVASNLVTGVPLSFEGGTVTSCPARNGFDNAIIGVTLNASMPSARDAVKSAPLGSSFDPVTVPGVGNKAFSVEIWFSTTQSPVADEENVLLELGGATGTGTSPGNGTNDFHFRITYTKSFGASDDRLSIRYTFQRNSGAFTVANANGICSGLVGDANYDSNLESIGTSAIGTVFMLIVTIDSNNIAVHLAPMGGSIGSCATSGMGLPIRNFGFPSTSVMRVGCTRSPGSSALRNFPGTVHFVAFYDSVLSQGTAEAFLAAGLPNSSPAVNSGAIPVAEDSMSVVNLNVSNLVFDMESNPVARFRIRSRPTNGVLTYNSISIPASGDFEVVDISRLRYRQNTPNVFSVVSGSTCTTAFDSFVFDASDLICDRSDTPKDDPKCNSVLTANARICVVDTQDLPTGVDVQPADVRSGNNRSIVLDPIDLDDRNGTSDNLPSLYRSHEPPFIGGLLSANVAVQFNVSSGIFGRLEFFNPSGSACNGTQVPINTWIPATPGARNFQFCFQAFPSPGQPTPGFDRFHYRFRDRGLGVGPFSKITIRVINPIVACPALTQVPSPLSAPCESSGDETTDASAERLIPVYLTGADTLNRQLRFVLNTLPAHGTLYVATGAEPNLGKGARVVIGAEYTATPHGIFKMVYVGHVHYFTRFNVSTESFWRYANWEGLGIDGCRGSGTSCRCPINVAPGCPDRFKYVVRAGSGQSDEGVYIIQVNGRPSPFTVAHPISFAYSITARFNFVGANTIAIQDPDDDTYRMSGRYNPVPGRLGTSLEGLTGRIFTENEYDCAINGCGEPILLWGTPTAMNVALSRLFFVYRGLVVGNETTLAMNFYKALPDGTTTSNAASVYSLPDNRVITNSLRIFILNAVPNSSVAASALRFTLLVSVALAWCMAVMF